jgi:hypothetical protein
VCGVCVVCVRCVCGVCVVCVWCVCYREKSVCVLKGEKCVWCVCVLSRNSIKSYSSL